MTAPLVPAEIDLRDFAFMPLDVQRLLTSETWILGSGDERAAAMTLWLTSWHQVPAGSLPENERMLERLADCKTWKKSKAHALRGWESGGDGRLYHPVVCEKALEAWLEKLAQRLSSGAGNARRWGVAFDPTPIETRMQEARALLSALNPDSRQLQKRRTAGLPKSSAGDPGGNPGVIPSGSQETETGTGTEREKTRAGGADAPLPPSDSKPKRKRKADGITFDEFTVACRELGEKAIPEGHPVFRFATDTRIPVAFIRLVWREFRRQHSEGGRRGKNRQEGIAGWRKTFDNAVRSDWYGLWKFSREGECYLTPAGEALRREAEAEPEPAAPKPEPAQPPLLKAVA